MCPWTTTLSRQRYVWTIAGIQCKQTKTIHYDWSLLNNRDISDKYVLTLRNKFDALQEISETPTPNDKYENFINAHMEVAVDYIPTKLKAKHRVLWEIVDVKKKCDNMKTASLCNKRNPTNANAQKLMTN